MTRLYSFLFLFILSTSAWAQQAVFQGRVELNRDLASLEADPPVTGSLYLLTGAASAVRILSEEPFSAEVDFVQGEWLSESDLVSHRVLLRFQGAGWADFVQTKKPRQDAAAVIYPYRKFQVAAVPGAGGFVVLAVPLLF